MIKPDSIAYPPRGMNHDEAARYVGVGPGKFDELVAARRMPRPKKIDGRNVWDRAALDAYFDEIRENESLMDGLVEKSRQEAERKKRRDGS